MEITKTHLSFGGAQHYARHASKACGCDMALSVFVPPQAEAGPVPALVWLSGLTCTEENFTAKTGAQRMAAERGVMIIAPDTSPRGDDVPDAADEYDFGKGAGFYLNATQEPWKTHYRMRDYIAEELIDAVAGVFPVDRARLGVFGHSMGGHGALTLHLTYPERFRTCSAFSPIVAPSEVPWGRKAFSRYLGPVEATWAAYDATALVRARPSTAEILIDQGEDDAFLEEQLRPELFEAAARAAEQKLTLRRHVGYDHSYFFIASFIDDHIAWHADRL